MKPTPYDILKQALADDAFDGAEIACYGDYAVSWDTMRAVVAIADSKGWWTMPTSVLIDIAAATPNPSMSPVITTQGPKITQAMMDAAEEDE